MVAIQRNRLAGYGGAAPTSLLEAKLLGVDGEWEMHDDVCLLVSRPVPGHEFFAWRARRRVEKFLVTILGVAHEAAVAQVLLFWNQSG
jgi:hypothetical protein